MGERAARRESADNGERADASEGAGVRERAETSESAESHERAETLESAENRERAATEKSAGTSERAEPVESADIRERAVREESAGTCERAARMESAESYERAEAAESAVCGEPPRYAMGYPHIESTGHALWDAQQTGWPDHSSVEAWRALVTEANKTKTKRDSADLPAFAEGYLGNSLATREQAEVEAAAERKPGTRR